MRWFQRALKVADIVKKRPDPKTGPSITVITADGPKTSVNEVYGREMPVYMTEGRGVSASAADGRRFKLSRAYAGVTITVEQSIGASHPSLE